MSRLFTASSTDRVEGTILPVDTGGFSMGAWVRFASTPATYSKIMVVNLGDLGGGQQMFFESGSKTAAIEQQTSGTATKSRGGDALLTADGVWYCLVGTQDGSMVGNNQFIYGGALNVAMSDVSSDRTDGTGTRTTGMSTVTFGNRPSDFARSFPGMIARPFMVPWVMSLADAEKFRCGDLSVLTASGSPRFSVPLNGSALLDELGGTGTWTATGATAAADPNFAKVADRAVRNSSGTGTATLTLTNPTLIRPGNYLVARVSVDNSGASGARPGLTAADTRNGTWTHGTGGLQDPGAASAGNATYLCYVKVTTAYQAGDTVVFTWTTGTPVSAIVIEEWFGINKTTPLAVAETQAGNVSTTTQPTIARTPALAGQLVYVCAGLEGISTSWGTQDADTTDGLWSDLTKDNGNTGTASTSESVYGGFKVSVGTTAQTWNNTLGVASDWSACAVVFAIEPGPVAVQGTAGAVVVTAGTATITIPAAALPPHNLHMVPGYAMHRSTLV